MKYIIFILLFFSSSSATLFAEGLSCKEFEGEWIGNKKGGSYQGNLMIIFDDECKYKWTRPNGKIITLGKIKIKNNKIFYYNEAGSRGQVYFDKNMLTWKNLYTGNTYKVIVKK